MERDQKKADFMKDVFTDKYRKRWVEGVEKYFDSNNTVMAHIARLREKLDDTAKKHKFIQTVWGVGYTIEKE